MAILPRYQRLGIVDRQPTQTDFADTREAAKLGLNISQQVNRMSDFAMKQGADDARMRGEELIRTDGALPTLADIKSKGGPRSIAEKSAYALGSQVAVAQVQADAEIDIMRILNDGEQNKTSFTQIQAQLRDLNDGYSSSLADVDPGASMLLQSRLGGAIGKAEERYSNYYVGVQAARAAKKLTTTADLKVNEILGQAIIAGSNSQKQLKASIAESVTLLAGLGATEAQLDAFEIGTYNAAYKEKAIFEFNKSSVPEQEEILSTMMTTNLPGMSLEQTQTFRKSLQSTYNNNVRIRTAKSSGVLADVREQTYVLSQGGMPNASTIQLLETEAMNLGDSGRAAQEAVRTLKFNAEMASIYRQMSVVDLTAEVDILKGGMEGQGGVGRDLPIEVDTYNTAVSYLAAAQRKVDGLEAQEKERFQPSIDFANESLDALKSELDSGEPLSQEAIDSLRSNIEKLPEELTREIVQDLLRLENQNVLATDLSTANPAVIQKFISDYLETGELISQSAGLDGSPGEVAFVGAKGVDTPYEFEVRDLAQKMLSNMTAELKADPISFAAKVGLNNGQGVGVNITPINFMDVENSSDQIAQRINDARLVSGKYGSPLKFLTVPETLAIKNLLENGSMSDQMMVLGIIVEGAGQNAPQFLEEISKETPFFAQVGALVTSQTGSGLASAEAALKGQILIEGKVGPAEFTTTNTNEPFRDLTSVALQFLPEGMPSIMLTAKAIYADVARYDDNFDEDKWTDSINRAMGADIDAGTGGVQEVRDLNTYIFPGFTSDNYENALETATPTDIMASISGASLDPEMLEALGGSKRIVVRPGQNAYTSGNDDYNLVYAGGDNYFIKYKNIERIVDTEGEAVLIDMRKLIEMTLP
jgi:hypothetical protein